jgi:hypothetical protein
MQLYRIRTFNPARLPGQKLIDVYIAAKYAQKARDVLDANFVVLESDPMLSDLVAANGHFLHPVRRTLDLKLFRAAGAVDLYVAAKTLNAAKVRLRKNGFLPSNYKFSAIRKPFIFD